VIVIRADRASADLPEPPYSSEKPYTGVKGPQRSEKAPCR